VSAAEELLRRYLRQRAELGGADLVLDRLSPAELRELLARGGAPAPPPHAPHAPAAAPAAEAAGGAGVPVPLSGGEGFDELRALALACRSCGLCEGRSQVVFGEGNPNADVLVVGEAPGAEEDRTGRPFVGRAGKLLDLLLASIGLSREAVYICNVLKCRPPGNRNPQPEEIEACSPLLRRQVELVAPRAVLAVGTFAAQTLLGSSVPIGRLRGQAHDFQGVPLVPTYHPAALLRNPSWIRPVWEDLQRLRVLVDRA
jgi:uracil-DNA glycosylase family 4